MDFLHHRQSRLLLSVAVMGCLCLSAFQTASAKGRRQAVSSAAQRKSHRLPAGKKQDKPAAAHEEWTKRAPVPDEFEATANNQSDKQDQIALQGKTL